MTIRELKNILDSIPERFDGTPVLVSNGVKDGLADDVIVHQGSKTGRVTDFWDVKTEDFWMMIVSEGVLFEKGAIKGVENE